MSNTESSNASALAAQSGLFPAFHESLPGTESLEERTDKRRFFDQLEGGGGGSPVDYSELNRQLGDTGLSSLTLG